MSSEILKKLHLVGQVNLVAEEVEDDPTLLAELFEAVVSPDPLVKKRAALVIGRVAGQRPDYLTPYTGRLIEALAVAGSREYRRHLIMLLPTLKLTELEKEQAGKLLDGFLTDKNVSVIIAAFEAMVELAGDDPEKQVRLLPMLDEMARTGSPAVRVRARRAQEKLYQSLTAER